MEAPVWRTGYNYDSDAESKRTGLKCEDKSLTVQSQAHEADINVIMKRYGVTGQVPSVAVPPTYGDFDTVGDYRTAVDLVRSADRSFMSFPAEFRSRFNNDPARFLDYIWSDKVDREELKKYGLIVPGAGDMVQKVDPKPVEDKK